MALVPVDSDGETQQPEQVQPQSIGDYAKREAGLLARAAINPATVGMAGGALIAAPMGATAMGARAGGAAGFLADIGAKIYNAIVAENTGMTKMPVLSDVLNEVKNQIGLPKPEGAVEKMQERAVETATSLVPVISGGRILADVATSPVLKSIGKALAASPRTQAVSAITSGAASGLAEEAGYGVPGQAVAATLGAVAPASISRMAQVAKTGTELGLGKLGALATSPAGISESSRAATIRLLRGGKTPQEIGKTIQEFQQAGTTPSAGQATASPNIQQIETTMSKFPSGYAKFREKGLTQQEEIGKRVEQIRAGLSPVKEPVVAGGMAAKSYEKVFVPNARKIQADLYNKADQLFPQNRVTVSNTENMLNEFAKRFEQSPELKNIFENKKIMAIRDAIRNSKNEEGMIPFQTLRDLRTEIGDQLSNIKPVSDTITQGQYKGLWGAVTEDIKNAVAPYESARNAYSRANNYTRAFHDRVDKIQNILTQKNGEDVYKMIVSGAKDGPSRLRDVLKSVPMEDQKAIVSTFVARMGRAVPSMQDETGDVFSTSRFLNNYAALDPKAKNELFGRFGSQFKKDMDKIANVAARIRESSQVLANPSGTAGAIVGPATVASLEGSLAAGKFGFATGMLGVLLQADQAARLMTSPKYVNWLASNLDTPISSAGAALASLANIGKDDPDIRSFIEEVQNQTK